jgi:hypothetical protein
MLQKRETIMRDAFSTPNRIKTIILLALCGLLAIAAVTIGIDDNPPGVLLAYLAATAFVLAFVHPWRTARQFGFLLLASALSLALCIILDIIFTTFTNGSATEGILQKFLQGLADTAFLLAALIFPVAFIVSVVGWAIMFIRNRRRST